MAITFLTAVEESLKAAGVLTANSTALTSLSGNTNQHEVDMSIRAWNDVIDDMVDRGCSLPNTTATANLTLVTSQREYSIESGGDVNVTDFQTLLFPLLDETNGDFIVEYKDRGAGSPYEQMRIDQPQPAQWTGTPLQAAWNPDSDKLRLDRIPTSSENGLVFKLRYKKQFELTSGSDSMPMEDEVTRALYIPVGELVNLYRSKEDRATANVAKIIGYSRALRMTRKRPNSKRY